MVFLESPDRALECSLGKERTESPDPCTGMVPLESPNPCTGVPLGKERTVTDHSSPVDFSQSGPFQQFLGILLDEAL